MSKEEKADSPTPIAARISAEPGWRAVVFRRGREIAEEGMIEISIEVVAILSWAIDAPFLRPPKPSHSAIFGSSALGSWGVGSSLWPIDPGTNQKFGEELHRLVPPCDDTDAQLVEAAKLWCAESIEKNKTATP